MAAVKKASDVKPPAPKQMVAAEPLSVDGVPAFGVGDVVPAEHVERRGWHDKVRHVPKPVELSAPAKPARELPAAGFMLATDVLYVGGVRAFNPGDRVHVDHVARFGWHGKVRDPDG